MHMYMNTHMKRPEADTARPPKSLNIFAFKTGSLMELGWLAGTLLSLTPEGWLAGVVRCCTLTQVLRFVQ